MIGPQSERPIRKDRASYYQQQDGSLKRERVSLLIYVGVVLGEIAIMQHDRDPKVRDRSQFSLKHRYEESYSIVPQVAQWASKGRDKQNYRFVLELAQQSSKRSDGNFSSQNIRRESTIAMGNPDGAFKSREQRTKRGSDSCRFSVGWVHFVSANLTWPVVEAEACPRQDLNLS